LAQKVRDGEVHKEEMAAHVSTFAFVLPYSLLCLCGMINNLASTVLPGEKLSQPSWHRLHASSSNILRSLNGWCPRFVARSRHIVRSTLHKHNVCHTYKLSSVKVFDLHLQALMVSQEYLLALRCMADIFLRV
jgi:hypothetical protein